MPQRDRWRARLLLIGAAFYACVPSEDDPQASATEGTSGTSTGSTTAEPATSDDWPSSSTSPTTSPGPTATSTSTTGFDNATDDTDTAATEGPTSTTGTTGGSRSICGDGIVGGDEECDDGPANDEHGACTDDCTIAYCGDEKIQIGKEACDFGEDDGEGKYNGDGSYNGCTALCQLGAHCGDNELQADHEDCEKMGPKMADGSQCVECKWDANLLFVSSMSYSGKLGGLEGADAKCQALAAAADLPSPELFMAWISDSDASPQSRFKPPIDGEYILPNGLEVASDWDSLVAGVDLQVAINVDETKTVITKPFRVWSNTTATGVGLDGSDCNGWTSDELGVLGSYGTASEVSALWSHTDTEWCSKKYRLYCVGSVG